ncbi:YicC family protein [Saprospira sp. CCB-QB6]|uniref:YicC/YloC family endoribonuclease n=1 Tax=Saprospira sp. CCB-QB6 TaxID=3023936 RepID=UPI0023490CF7|nr:YicC/YloC family endoribonuclease [Saprospira sp. CCB-QB6]WCL81219.1 YicC family protein [Saprospira sp. CCB-QB6]
MLYSMTGYGRGQKQGNKGHYLVEIRAVNSKGCDLRLRLPLQFQAKEMELRRLLQQRLGRGKIDFSLQLSQAEKSDYRIDEGAFLAYAKQLKALGAELEVPAGDLLYTVSRLPAVVVQNDDSLSEESWAELLAAVDLAIAQFDSFRAEEGLAMQKDLLGRVEEIEALLQELPRHEEERLQNVRERLQNNLESISLKKELDENRFEQELLYYLDKLDISEEKVRLAQHCQYFKEVLLAKQPAQKGKKLNFINQEMGREINTLGSKANHAPIQRLVIQMKEEADKIKEQLANVL